VVSIPRLFETSPNWQAFMARACSLRNLITYCRDHHDDVETAVKQRRRTSA
jgi:hypothetical protein